MLARGDQARSRSRQSFTTGTSSSHETASSTTAWSQRSMNDRHGGGPGTARTSVWSSGGGSDDGKTAMPDLLGTDGEDSDVRRGQGVGRSPVVHRQTGRVGKLIDLGSESEREAPRQQVSSTNSNGEPTPGEKLRALLRQMNSDVSDMAPARAPSPPRLAASPELRPSGSSSEGRAARVSAWRTQRTGEFGSAYDRTDEERDDEGEDNEEPIAGPSYTSSPERPIQRADGGRRRSIQSDSPPTPPPRVMNPYLHTGRKISLEKKEERIPTRVAVLHASESVCASL